MSIETAGIGTLIIVLTMFATTLVGRWGGIVMMSYVPINRKVKQFINAMSGSVLVALLAPLALDGDNGARLALLTTIVLMLLVKKPMVAIGGGMLAAALVRLI